MSRSVYMKRLDIIQSEINERVLKPNGFKKKGRSHNRTALDGLTQVITFQVGQSYRGDNDFFSVFIGVRVPESFERTYVEDIPLKAFYQYYHCNIVTCINEPLGHAAFKHKRVRYNSKCFSLAEENNQPIIDEVVEKIEKYVFPMLSDLDTREKIIENRLKYWDKYKEFELANSFVYNLDTAMIYGHFGNIEKVTRMIRQAYDDASKLPASQGYVEELSSRLGIVIDTSKRNK